MNKPACFAAFGLILLCGAVVLMAQTSAAQGGDFSLKRYRDSNRLALVFAPDSENALYRKQAALWNGKRAGLNERDIVRFNVFERGGGTVGGAALAAADARALCKQFGMRRGAFRVILVGKDGHTALSTGSPVSAARLFRLIDAMPMRREEIKRKGVGVRGSGVG